jgi:uncharacterized YigZ family protein
MKDTYRSLEKPAEGIFRDRNSRFLAFGFPVKTGNEVNELLADLRKKYHDARHQCYAYRLGYSEDDYRFSDDGEPSGTAGKPILGQLVSHDLTNTLAVVVRYFGGTLLGTGGLINAYRSATADMLSKASIMLHHVEEHFHLGFPYERLNQVMKILKAEHIAPLHSEVNMQCSMDIAVSRSASGRLMAGLSAVHGLTIEPVQMSD